MSSMHTDVNQIWVELVGQIIIARVRGELTEDLLNERHDRLVQLRYDTGCTKVLIDDLEMLPPSLDLVEAQQMLNLELNAAGIHTAVVVPNSRLAYLARLQFGNGCHIVFYNDLPGAVRWLTEPQNQ